MALGVDGVPAGGDVGGVGDCRVVVKRERDPPRSTLVFLLTSSSADEVSRHSRNVWRCGTW